MTIIPNSHRKWAYSRKSITALLLLLIFIISLPAGLAQNRFPKPDFESGYQYPEAAYPTSHEMLWTTIDIAMLVILMSAVAYSVIRRRARMPVTVVSVISVLYFGFLRHGCVCSIGSIQNVALALVDTSYAIPISVILFFTLPIAFTILFGRVFCAGVCPFGALQELINVKNYRLSKALTTVLGLIPWIYLAFALLFAITRSGFIICRFDPFVWIFRLGGDVTLIVFGVMLLIASIFTGRPFCRFICPYGALLSLFPRISIWKTSIAKKQCINCELCHNACPVDAIRPPYDNKVKEQRTYGVKRVLIYFIVLPVMALLGAFLMRMMSDTFSNANKEVRLYEILWQDEKQPQEVQPIEIQIFYGQGGSIEQLVPKVEKIKADFKFYATIMGVFLGIIIGFTLIGLSLKRTRKYYEIDDSACVNCGRCFHYCPQNKTSGEHQKRVLL